MEFEYDSRKSASNKAKHGISLEEAKILWEFPGVIFEAKVEGEMRELRIAKLGDKFYSCIYTLRGKNIRLISARRSRDREIKIYQEVIKNEERKKED